MNEDLIYKFADQANYSNLACSYDDLDIIKFSELIVRECQLLVDQYINECGEVASMPDTVIMKHFGIK